MARGVKQLSPALRDAVRRDCVRVHVRRRSQALAGTRTNIHPPTHPQTETHTHTHARTHAHTHTRTHAHTHTYGVVKNRLLIYARRTQTFTNGLIIACCCIIPSMITEAYKLIEAHFIPSFESAPAHPFLQRDWIMDIVFANSLIGPVDSVVFNMFCITTEAPWSATCWDFSSLIILQQSGLKWHGV